MMREHCWIQLRHNNIFCRLNQHHRQFRFGFRFRWMLYLLILGCSIVVAHKHDDQNNNLLFIRRNNNKRAADSHHNDNNNNNNNPNLLLASTYPATSLEEVQIPWDAQITGISDRRKREPLFKFNKKMGRVNMDLGRPTSTVTTSSRRLILPKTTFSRNITTTTTATPGHSVSATTSGEDVLSISMDPFAAIRLIQVLSLASKSFMSAFLGTLRLLGPLIFTRRALVPLGELLSDYMMGRYLRQTYHKIDRQYWKHYEGPAATRALARAAIQMFVLMQVGRMMEWMVGLQQDPCHIDGLGTCHWWCGVLWLISTVGTGNIAVAMVRKEIQLLLLLWFVECMVAILKNGIILTTYFLSFILLFSYQSFCGHCVSR